MEIILFLVGGILLYMFITFVIGVFIHKERKGKIQLYIKTIKKIYIEVENYLSEEDKIIYNNFFTYYDRLEYYNYKVQEYREQEDFLYELKKTYNNLSNLKKILISENINSVEEFENLKKMFNDIDKRMKNNLKN